MTDRFEERARLRNLTTLAKAMLPNESPRSEGTAPAANSPKIPDSSPAAPSDMLRDSFDDGPPFAPVESMEIPAAPASGAPSTDEIAWVIVRNPSAMGLAYFMGFEATNNWSTAWSKHPNDAKRYPNKHVANAALREGRSICSDLQLGCFIPDARVEEHMWCAAPSDAGAPTPQGCPTCGGKGVVLWDPAMPTSINGTSGGPWPCPTCHGLRVLNPAAFAATPPATTEQP